MTRYCSAILELRSSKKHSQQSTKDAIGTVAYMAPEQLQGKPCFASDQYALGIMIYEWISGNTPFQGSPTEIGTQHLFTQPPSLRKQIPTLSPEVEQMIFRALEKIQRTFPEIQTFVHALTHATDHSRPQTRTRTNTIIDFILHEN